MAVVIVVDAPPGSGKSELIEYAAAHRKTVRVIDEPRAYGRNYLGIDLDEILERDGPVAGLKAAFRIETHRRIYLDYLIHETGGEEIFVDKSVPFIIASGFARLAISKQEAEHANENEIALPEFSEKLPVLPFPALSGIPNFIAFPEPWIMPDYIMYIQRNPEKRAESIHRRGNSRNDMDFNLRTCAPGYDRMLNRAYKPLTFGFRRVNLANNGSFQEAKDNFVRTLDHLA